MNLDAILEVVIGLVFAWLVLSVATMQIQEWLSAIFSWRANYLEEAIHNMLGNDQLVKAFYEHPLIQSLSQPKRSDEHRKPSYIPSPIFAQAMLDVLMSAGGADQGVVTGTLSPVQMRNSVRMLKAENPHLEGTLKYVFPNVEDENVPLEYKLAVSRFNLQSWFNDAMDRLSGWYQRHAQTWAFVLGLLLAVTLNVDTIQISNQLWREPTVRQALIAQAQSAELGQTGTSSPLRLREYYTNYLSIPIGWSTVPSENPGACGVFPGLDLQPSLWINGECRTLVNLPAMSDGWGWLTKLLGLLLSGVAAAQGAPFWFDVLKKLINIRGAGSVPTETPPSLPTQPQSTPSQPVG
jgi:hypothetical protein